MPYLDCASEYLTLEGIQAIFPFMLDTGGAWLGGCFIMKTIGKLPKEEQ